MILDRLDDERMRQLITEARKLQSNDPVNAFIASWAAFHCYYSAFADEYKVDYLVWANDQKEKGLKPRWQFLVNHNAFRDFFDTFRKQNPSVVENLFPVPDEQVMETGPDTAQVFSLVYLKWLRLFHMGKERFTDKNEAQCAGAFLASFLSELLQNTGHSTNRLNPACS